MERDAREELLLNPKPGTAAAASAEKQGENKPEEKKTEEKKGDEKKAEDKAPKPILVDSDGIGQRVVHAPIPAGIYDNL